MKNCMMETVTLSLELAGESNKTLEEAMPALLALPLRPGHEFRFSYAGGAVDVHAFENPAYALVESLKAKLYDDEFKTMLVSELLAREFYSVQVVLLDGMKLYEFDGEEGLCMTLSSLLTHLEWLPEDYFLECRDGIWATLSEHENPGMLLDHSDEYMDEAFSL